jgi:hypothetical protein
MVSYRQITSAGRVSRRTIAHGWLNKFRRGKIMMQGDVDRRTSEGLLSEQKSVVCTHVRKQSIEDDSLDTDGPHFPLVGESVAATRRRRGR